MPLGVVKQEKERNRDGILTVYSYTESKAIPQEAFMLPNISWKVALFPDRDFNPPLTSALTDGFCEQCCC